ncbi:S9 family peptidase [Marinitenerispora sediminis]|uniref:S9 family peptidase n=1 Tax=Marinitenerispora sediminis TaxID=1931232 RepID=A0A368T8J7_9ACTN|nr:prolyl oligopeptidase family serine peptidase [Marinitenerispora sediminis]RCV53602.1 S9 family peptidase [Marinitenerispora sediminis]RCV60669.1 S9 family peptidase [Marinitenerispora sediminis]
MSFPRQQARTRRFTLGVPRAFQISPDGGRVAFLRGRDGTDTATSLWTVDLDGTERVVADPRRIGRLDEDLPPEERARRERLRETGGGIVAYSVDEAFARAVFTLSGRLYTVGLGGGGDPRELPAAAPVIDPVISPRGDAVAYVSGGAIHVLDLDSGADRVVAEPDGPDVTWGLAEFIAAEEMGRYRGMWWAPDGSALLAARVDDAPVTRWHISDPANPEAAAQVVAYPAAGTANADVRLAVLPLAGGGPAAPTWVEWDRAALPYLASAGWRTAPQDRPAEPVLVVQSRDQRTLRLLGADPGTGRTRLLAEETHDAWVEVPSGVPAATEGGAAVWIGVRDGQRRLIVGDAPVTPSDLYVRAVGDVDGDTVLFTASRDPVEIDLWSFHPADGLRRLTEPGGVHAGRLRGGTLVVQRRSLDSSEVDTRVRRGGEQAAVVGSFAERPELPDFSVTLLRAGERELRTAVLLPSWHEPGSRRLPVLMDPYGGPHAQRVLAARGAHLTSQWFAEQGFAVVVADGRGSPGRDPEWEYALHGDLAGPPLEDQVAALHATAERVADLDLERVAIRGWSFGGYLAALAVLRRPDVFHAAVAGAPVTDWRLYDTHYTERYLGMPQREEAAYRDSSLLADAGALSRPLMLIHGLADDNVVFAHSQRLSSALLAAGRPHTVLPLSGITHMPTEESTAENLLLLQVEFLRSALGLTS